MKITFIKDCGHHKAESVEEVEHVAGAQYMVAGFAIPYAEPAPEPAPEPVVEPAPEPAPKKPAKSKAKKE